VIVTHRLAGLLALALLPSATVAQHTAGSYFSAADLDRDQQLSLNEYQEWMSYAFRRMDSNNDGVLEPDEQLVPNAPRLTIAQHHARLAEQFKRQDSNGDGGLSQREFLAPPR